MLPSPAPRLRPTPIKHRIEAPAKINLALEVLGLLPGGYHELDTVFAWLDLHDVLEWQPAPALRLEMSGATDISCGEENLVMRAVRLLEQQSGRSFPIHIRLEKRIPAGGGLGGGSSDAGAMLYSLNQGYELGYSWAQLEHLGGQLGADVAYCVRGGTRRGRNRGEALETLPDAPALSVLVVCPPFPCPTGAVYSRWDATQPRPARGCCERMVRALSERNAAEVLQALGNDLQPAAEELRPELLHFQQVMRDSGCSHTLLSGSGSSLLAFFLSEDEARRCQAALPWPGQLARARGPR